MTLNKLSDFYQQYLFIVYLPITFILWLLLVIGSPFIVGAHTLVIASIIIYIIISLNKIKLDLNYFLVIFFLIYCVSLTTIHYSHYDLIDLHNRSLAKYHYNLYLLYFASYLYGRYVSFKVNTINYIILAILLILISSIADISTYSLNFDLFDEDTKRSLLRAI